MAASPLIAGGVLYTMDEFSISLLTNPDILECNQNGVVGKLIHRLDKIDVWKTIENGNPDNGWIGIFNRNKEKENTIQLSFKELGLNTDNQYLLKDLWKQTNLLISGTTNSFTIPADGCVFIRYLKNR